MLVSVENLTEIQKRVIIAIYEATSETLNFNRTKDVKAAYGEEERVGDFNAGFVFISRYGNSCG